MTLDTGSDGWYYDARTASDGVNGGTAWTYGIEKWCNLEGRYMYIIADFSHLLQSPYSYSTYTMSLCNLGIMGTKYEHNEPPPTEITLEKGSTKTFDISHITSTLTIGNTL